MTPPALSITHVNWQFPHLCPVSALRQGEGFTSIPSAHSSRVTSTHKQPSLDEGPQTVDLDVSAVHIATPRLDPQGAADLNTTPWLPGLSADSRLPGPQLSPLCRHVAGQETRRTLVRDGFEIVFSQGVRAERICCLNNICLPKGGEKLINRVCNIGPIVFFAFIFNLLL